MNLVFDENPTSDEIKSFHGGLIKYNDQFVEDDFERFSIVVKSEGDIVVGGIEVETYWGRSYIHNLWVEEGIRKKGIGAELLKRAEKIVKSKGCHGVEVSTMSFQSEEFYKKNGFRCFGKTENYVDGYQCIYFTKEI